MKHNTTNTTTATPATNDYGAFWTPETMTLHVGLLRHVIKRIAGTSNLSEDGQTTTGGHRNAEACLAIVNSGYTDAIYEDIEQDFALWLVTPISGLYRPCDFSIIGDDGKVVFGSFGATPDSTPKPLPYHIYGLVEQCLDEAKKSYQCKGGKCVAYTELAENRYTYDGNIQALYDRADFQSLLSWISSHTDSDAILNQYAYIIDSMMLGARDETIAECLGVSAITVKRRIADIRKLYREYKAHKGIVTGSALDCHNSPARGYYGQRFGGEKGFYPHYNYFKTGEAVPETSFAELSPVRQSASLHSNNQPHMAYNGYLWYDTRFLLPERTGRNAEADFVREHIGTSTKPKDPQQGSFERALVRQKLSNPTITVYHGKPATIETPYKARKRRKKAILSKLLNPSDCPSVVGRTVPLDDDTQHMIDGLHRGHKAYIPLWSKYLRGLVADDKAVIDKPDVIAKVHGAKHWDEVGAKSYKPYNPIGIEYYPTLGVKVQKH